MELPTREQFLSSVEVTDAVLERTDLSLQCVLVLLFCENEGLQMTRLAEKLDAFNQSVTKTVAFLIERKLAKRTTKPGDRRAVMVEVTKKGRETINQLFQS